MRKRLAKKLFDALQFVMMSRLFALSQKQGWVRSGSLFLLFGGLGGCATFPAVSHGASSVHFVSPPPSHAPVTLQQAKGRARAGRPFGSSVGSQNVMGWIPSSKEEIFDDMPSGSDRGSAPPAEPAAPATPLSTDTDPDEADDTSAARPEEDLAELADPLVPPTPERRPVLACMADEGHRRLALRRVAQTPVLEDDLLSEGESLPAFAKSIQQHLAAFERSKRVGPFVFEDRTLTKSEYGWGIRHLGELACSAEGKGEFLQNVARDYELFEPYGYQKIDKTTGMVTEDFGPGSVKFTGYYRVIARGSLTRTSVYSQAIYRRPPDLQTDGKNWFHWVHQRVRVGKKKWETRTVMAPYYTRQQIERGRVVNRKKLALVYVSPVDAFLMRIEGSGTVVLRNGKKIFLKTDGQNGIKCGGYGQAMVQQAIKMGLTAPDYLRQLPAKKALPLIAHDRSYVFFTEGTGDTFLGARAIAGRTFATDRRYFPKGAVVFARTQLPTFASPTDTVPTGKRAVSCIGFDDDTGGAIRGTGHADWFLGEGLEAEKMAHRVGYMGTLYYLVPKPEVLAAHFVLASDVSVNDSAQVSCAQATRSVGPLATAAKRPLSAKSSRSF